MQIQKLLDHECMNYLRGSFWYLYLKLPNSPPNKLGLLDRLPPPPPLPLLRASVLIHSFSHSLSFISFGSVTFVTIWASPLSKLNSVGMLLIMYVKPRPLSMMSWESYSISQSDTPPSSSPTPDETSSERSGSTVLHVWQ